MTSPDITTVDKAIADLQSRVAFQEDTLQTLNQVVAAQEANIMRLQQQLTILNKRINDVASSVEHNAGAPGEEAPPPHY